VIAPKESGARIVVPSESFPPGTFPSSGPRTSQIPPRRYSRSARELDERRRALPKVLAFFLVGWGAFVVLDVYIGLVLFPESPLAWLIGWRMWGILVICAMFVASRRRDLGRGATNAIELVTFVNAGACLALDAIVAGGLNSHYLPGMSLVVMVQTMALATRWRRSIAGALLTILTFPAVMSVAALFEPEIAAQWRDAHALAVFGLDFMIVLGTALGCAGGANLIWAWRRQVFHARRLGRYRLRARIGGGGMGEVWLAWDGSLKREVALKILASDAAMKPESVARFEREALAASSLKSPHTIRVFDFGATDDGVWFMAMEHLVGADLATLVAAHGPMPPSRVIHFARQACASLGEAHAAGIVHRDIKPGNLFVTQTDDDPDFVKVFDFGIAKLDDGEDGRDAHTATGFVTGTPAYMSPEVCKGASADARSDVYSMGAVLYFLVTGVPPFLLDNARALMLAHVEEAPVAPSKRVAIAGDLEQVILRCLAKKPEDRYAGARELDAALAACHVPAWTHEEARLFWDAYLSRPRSPSLAFAEMETLRRA
jgi:serine/threonine-protein kinase